MMKILTIVLLVVTSFTLGVGCAKEPNKADDTRNLSENGDTKTIPINDTNMDSPKPEVDESTEDENTIVKYLDNVSERELSEEDIVGRAYMLATYDENDNMLSTSFYDKDGKKSFGSEEWNNMIHRFEYTYDDNGNETSKTTVGLDGEKVASYLPSGVYRWEWTYNAKGDIITERMLYLSGTIREFVFEEGEMVTENFYEADE